MTNRTERIRRTTTFAVVERLRAIEPHPDPRIERLEIVELTSGVRLVTGKHYRAGDLGIYIRPGALIPGWLAEQLWLVGRKRAHAWFEVREIPIGLGDGIKVNSPGLWCGQFYKHDTSAESLEHFADMAAAGGVVGMRGEQEGWISWPYWRLEWREGFTLDGHLGIVEAIEPEHVIRHNPAFTARVRQTRPRSSVEEHRLVKPEVAAKTTEVVGPALRGLADASAVEASGATPAVGST